MAPSPSSVLLREVSQGDDRPPDLKTAPRAPAARREWPFLLVAALASGAAAVLFRVGGQGVFHDAWNYYVLAQVIAAGGLFGYAIGPAAAIGPYFPLLLQVKPNGYPLFVALCGLLSTFEPDGLHQVVFVVQLLIYLVVCRFAASRLGGIFQSRSIELGVFAATALNPLLLIQTTELLSDLLSATLVYLAIVLALPRSSPTRGPAPARPFFLSFLVASLATIVRSANVVVIGALAVIWLLRWLWFRDVRWRLAPAVVALAVLPFIPQVVNNDLAFGSTSPFVARNEYAGDLDFGARIVKYMTVVDPNEKPQWVYANPFLPSGETTVDEFVHTQPFGYVATLALHAFTLLDQDYPFTFVTNLHPWYRWPFSIANYAFLGLGVWGLYVGLRGQFGWRLQARSFALLTVFLACGACVAIYIPPHVENRYSLPLYPLLGLPVVVALSWLRDLFRQRRLRPLSLALASAAVFLAACTALSAWVSSFLQPLF